MHHSFLQRWIAEVVESAYVIACQQMIQKMHATIAVGAVVGEQMHIGTELTVSDLVEIGYQELQLH
jgi:hypothetical protein